MNQRMSIAVIVVLLSAAAFRQPKTPEFVAVAGTYVATTSTTEGAKQLTLTLNDDATVELSTISPGDTGQPKMETGGWILDGPRVQIALSGSPAPGDETGVSLERKGDTLVAPGADEGESHFAGLTFQRDGTASPDSNPN